MIGHICNHIFDMEVGQGEMHHKILEINFLHNEYYVNLSAR